MPNPDIEEKEEKNRTNFDLMIKYMEINATQNTLMNYLNYHFSFLSNKNKTTDYLSFYHWTQFPLPIAERLYAVFTNSTERPSITQECFIKEITSLYLSNVEIQIKTIFNMFDWNNDSVVLIDDVKLLFIHLMIYSDKAHHSKGIAIIQEFFEEDKSMTYESFYMKTISFNSNCFYLFMFILFLHKPFTNKSLRFFYSNTSQGEKNNYSQNKWIYSHIIEPSEQLYEFFYDAFEIPFNINSDLDVLDEFEESLNECRSLLNPSLQLTKKKILRNITFSRTSKSTNESFIISDDKRDYTTFNKSIDDYFFSAEFTIHEGKQMKKYRLLIIDNDIYILKKVNNCEYSFKQVIPLREIYCEEGEESEKKIDNETQIIFFPFHIISTISQYYRDSLLYFDSIDQLINVKQQIESKTHHRNFEDYYSVISQIDNGAYGKIFTASQISTNKIYAVKAMKKCNEDYQDFDHLKYIRSEQYISKFLQANPHKGIITIIDILETKNKVYIIQEYIKNGNLFRYTFNPQASISHEKTSLFLTQVIEAVTFLKMNGIVHRDLKLENILIDKDPKQHHLQTKLIDFGLSRIILKEEELKGINGTISYLPPEMLMKNSCYSFNIDVWNIGLIGYVMLYGFNPFKEKTIDNMLKKRENCILSFPSLDGSSTNHIRTLIKSCLEKNHLMRPQIEKINQQCLANN